MATAGFKNEIVLWDCDMSMIQLDKFGIQAAVTEGGATYYVWPSEAQARVAAEAAAEADEWGDVQDYEVSDEVSDVST